MAEIERLHFVCDVARGGLLKRFKLSRPAIRILMAIGQNRELKFSAMAGARQ